MSIISVSRLDESNDSYTLFGNGRCVSFKLDDEGTLMDKVIATCNIVFTGTKHYDQLYYLDMPCWRTEVVNAVETKTLSRLEQVHQKLGHLNYDSI